MMSHERITIDLKRAEKFIKENGFEVMLSGQFGVSFKKGEKITACVLKSGIMNAQIPPKIVEEEKIKDEILGIYKSLLVEGLGCPSTLIPSI
jgi:hypothetical protein